jgi:hypothetical protein
LSVLSYDPDTTRPFDRMTTQKTCAPRGVDAIDARLAWTLAPRMVRVPTQRRRAAIARLGSHGLCSDTVAHRFVRELQNPPEHLRGNTGATVFISPTFPAGLGTRWNLKL